MATFLGYAAPVGAQTTALTGPNVGNTGFKNDQIPNPDPNNPNPIYKMQDIGTVETPNVPTPKGSAPFSFDIGWVDNNGMYYLADRTNGGLDIVNNPYNNNTFNTTVGGFVGWTGDNDTSGPNGVVTDDQGNVAWVGDGDSTLKVVDLNARKVAAVVPTGGQKRADELAYDPKDQVILIANDADDPPFITFIDSAHNNVLGQIKYPDATNGIEQSVYNKGDGFFYIAIPQTNQNQGGQIDRIDPKSMKVVATFPTPNCVPHGLAVNTGKNQLLLGCSGDGIKLSGQAMTQIMDAASGNIVKTITQVGGADEVWYLPGQERYFVAASSMTSDGTPDGKPNPVLGVIDAVTNTWIENVKTEAGAHSVAADPLSYQVYVPLRSQGIEMFVSPPPLNATVYMTDTGFVPPIVNVGQGSGALVGIVTVINKGTKTHSITELDSSPGFHVTAAGGVAVGGLAFSAGGTIPVQSGGGANYQLNTGGIGPGQQQTIGFQGTDADYVYSSEPDCLKGNSNPNFDCKTTYAIHVTDYQGDQKLAKSVAGTMVAPPGTDPTQCVENRIQQMIDSQGHPTGQNMILCILNYRIRAKNTGSDQHPLSGEIQVSIEDINGFVPAKPYVVAGRTTMVWTNKGQLAHDVYYKPAVWANYTSNGRNIVDSGLLYPGQSYSYSFPIPLTSSASVTSAIRSDSINLNETPQTQGSKAYKSTSKSFSLPSLYQQSVKVDCLPTEFVPFGAAQGVGRGLPCQTVNPVLSTPSYLGATKA
ncbi:MAG TPA: hypothetical protein VK009_13120 [Chloroflexota bacterium]|nr:hypothetical protein [Chloroflexota bacterium]